MKKRLKDKTCWLTILFGLFLCSCGQAYKEEIVDNYYLYASDEIEQLSLTYYNGSYDENYGTLISATIFAIGYNEEFIIVKQHPRKFPKSPDKMVTNYYIVKVEKKIDWRNLSNVYGPMTKAEYLKKREDFNIPLEVKFSTTFKSLE